MGKMNLDRAWIHGGETYGPGDAEVPDEAAKAITAKLEGEQAKAKAEESRLESINAARELEMQRADEAAGGNKAPGVQKQSGPAPAAANPPAVNPPSQQPSHAQPTPTPISDAGVVGNEPPPRGRVPAGEAEQKAAAEAEAKANAGQGKGK